MSDKKKVLYLKKSQLDPASQLDLAKAKAEIGEIHEWGNGLKMKKTAQGWVPVKGGEKQGGEQEGGGIQGGGPGEPSEGPNKIQQAFLHTAMKSIPTQAKSIQNQGDAIKSQKENPPAMEVLQQQKEAITKQSDHLATQIANLEGMKQAYESSANTEGMLLTDMLSKQASDQQQQMDEHHKMLDEQMTAAKSSPEHISSQISEFASNLKESHPEVSKDLADIISRLKEKKSDVDSEIESKESVMKNIDKDFDERGGTIRSNIDIDGVDYEITRDSEDGHSIIWHVDDHVRVLKIPFDKAANVKEALTIAKKKNDKLVAKLKEKKEKK